MIINTCLERAPAIILIEPREAGNIGSTARAMMNFGMTDLKLLQGKWHRVQTIF